MNKNQLREKYGNEQVYVVPYADTIDIPDGFHPEKVNLARLEKGGKFIYRYDAEYNEAFCQLIPYIVLINKGRDKIYVARRKAGDERLTNTLSFFGGHINPCDGKDLSVINGAAKRELEEETEYTPLKETKFDIVGTVREKTSPTKEHLGVVYVVNVRSAKIRETDTLEGVWMTYEKLIRNYSKFEGWAKKIIDRIFIERKKNNYFILKGGNADENR